MKFSRGIYIIILSLLIAGVLVGTLFREDVSSETRLLSQNDLTFAHNYVSYVLESETMTFQLFGMKPADAKTALNNETITSLALNNEALEIVDFTVETGITHAEYTLVSFLIEVRVTGNTVQQADELLISYRDNSPVPFPLGEFTVKQETEEARDAFATVGGYTAGYSSPALDIHLESLYEDTVVLERIVDLNNNFSFTFSDAVELPPDQRRNIVIPDFPISDSFDFYTISPIVKYTFHEEEREYALPGVLYNMMEPDEEKIERMLRSTQE